MDRLEFIGKCGRVCVGLVATSLVLSSCIAPIYVVADKDKNDLVVAIDSFQKGRRKYMDYLIIQHEELQYPIALFRYEEAEFGAFLMRCTHQGTELQIYGDRLTCPAHGSEFSNQGDVKNGPASGNLIQFNLTISKTYVRIHI